MAKESIIPKSFYLGGKKYTVKRMQVLRDGDAHGCLYHTLCLIKLSEKTLDSEEVVNKSEQDIEQTFYHELVHGILQNMGENEINKDEKFVDLFATFLHQYMTTKKV